MACALPLIPAQAGIQGNNTDIDCVALGPRLRGDERIIHSLASASLRTARAMINRWISEVPS